MAERIERLINVRTEWTPAGRHVRRNARHFWGPQIRTGEVVRWPYLDAPTAPTDERDLAAVAVRTLCEDGHAGAEYIVTGPQSLTQAEQVHTIEGAIGRSLRVKRSRQTRRGRSCSRSGFVDLDKYAAQRLGCRHRSTGVCDIHVWGRYRSTATDLPRMGR